MYLYYILSNGRFVWLSAEQSQPPYALDAARASLGETPRLEDFNPLMLTAAKKSLAILIKSRRNSIIGILFNL